MSLLGDFLKSVLEREEVQEAAASLLIDFFQPKPGLESAKEIIITVPAEEVKEKKALDEGNGDP